MYFLFKKISQLSKKGNLNTFKWAGPYFMFWGLPVSASKAQSYPKGKIPAGMDASWPEAHSPQDLLGSPAWNTCFYSELQQSVGR